MFSSKQGPLGQVWSSHSIICRRAFARPDQLVITGLGRASARCVIIMPPPTHKVGYGRHIVFVLSAHPTSYWYTDGHWPNPEPEK